MTDSNWLMPKSNGVACCTETESAARILYLPPTERIVPVTQTFSAKVTCSFANLPAYLVIIFSGDIA
jgi:hypothetical protein